MPDGPNHTDTARTLQEGIADYWPGAPFPPVELDPAAAWQVAVARAQIPDHWRSRMRYVGTDGTTVRVVVPDSFTRTWVMDRYLQDLQRHLAELTGRPVRVSLKVPRRR